MVYIIQILIWTSNVSYVMHAETWLSTHNANSYTLKIAL